ncbi:glycosyltransferase [bacterium]|nr:glycosyltransferase [Verrucomicrobiota bacterium]MDC0267907.1 glycosyltransferase [bacterium]
MEQPIHSEHLEPNDASAMRTYRHNVLIVGDTRSDFWAADLGEAFTQVQANVRVLPLEPRRLEEHWFEYRRGFINLHIDEPIIQRIRDQVNKVSPRLILFLDPFGMEPAFFKAIQRDLKKKAILASWFSDCRRTSWEGIQCFDHVFYTDSSMVDSLVKARKGDNKALKYLPLAVNEKRFRPGGVDHRLNKLMFAGTITATRKKTLNRLRLRGVPILWKGPIQHRLWSKWRGYRLDTETLNRLYQEYSVTLNLPRRPKNMNGVNFRVFEVSACQNLLLTKWTPDLELLFDPYEEMVVYRDWDEIPLVFRSLMYDPYRAEEIALNGRKRLIKNHTYQHRIQTILERIGQKAC